jgi:hypothetical protein
MTLSALIALLEESKEGSRELDIAIAKAMYPETTYDAAEDKWYLHGFHVRIEEYTRSLDSALSLVPEGWCLHLLADHYRYSTACLHRAFGPDEDQKVWRVGHHWPSKYSASARAPTKPLALVIAALKARGG